MSHRPLLVVLTAAALTLLSPGPAIADVVGPDADGCIDGSLPSSCHGGPYCRPDTCSTDDNCSDGKTCQALDVCVGSIGCAGMLGPDEDPSDYAQDDITGTCTLGATDACSTCATVNVCADPATGGGGDGSDEGDGGCQGAAAGGATLLSLLGLGGIAAWRRRRDASPA